MFSRHTNSVAVFLLLHLLVAGVRSSGDDFDTGTCKEGNRQSPIDISMGDVASYKFKPFAFNDHYRQRLSFLVRNNGHTVKASLDSGNHYKPMVWGGGLPGRYIFEQLHFHWDAEHTIDGLRAPLEMHVVHYNEKYGGMSEAANHGDGIAVFAVLFDENSPRNHEMEVIFRWIQNNIVYGENSDELSQSNFITDENSLHGPLLHLRNLLPVFVNSFVRYNGSLTTPPCNEAVQWTIFLERFHVSGSMLRDFRKLLDHHGHLILKNFRECQPLNGREVLIQRNTGKRNDGTTSKLSNYVAIVTITAWLFFHHTV